MLRPAGCFMIVQETLFTCEKYDCIGVKCKWVLGGVWPYRSTVVRTEATCRDLPGTLASLWL